MQTKYLFAVCFSLFTLGAIQAQDISISFSVDGKESLDSVYVYNKTKKAGVSVPIGSVVILGKNVGVDDVESGKNGLSIIPNPIIDDALLSFPLSTSGNTKIQAFSLDGTLLGGMNSELEAGINSIRMKLPKGACLINVSSKGRNYTSKVISTNSSVSEPSFALESNVSSSILKPRKAPTNAVALNYENGDSILYTGYSSVFTSLVGYDFPTISKEVKFKITPQTDADVEEYLNLINSIFSIGWGLTDIQDTKISIRQMWSVYCCDNGWSQISSATTDEMYDKWNSRSQFEWEKNESQYLYSGLYQRTKVVAQITGYLYSLENQLVYLQNKPFKTAEDVTSIAVRKRAIAEFHSLRGWLMFLLYDWFGAVDVQLDPSKFSFKNYSFRPANDASYTLKYLNAMVSDFKLALPDLESTTHQNSPYWGHVNKNMTRMLLMKHYMNRASATSKTEYWDSAKVYCDEVINEGAYSLNPVYSKVFSEIDSTGATNGNNEVIWAATYGTKELPATNMAGGWEQYGCHFKTNLPQKCDSICGFETDPSNWSGFVMPWSFYYNYDQTGVASGKPKDVRLYTIAEKYHDSSYGWVTKDDPRFLLGYGAIVVKWLISKDRSSKGQYCMPAFRYADVLLSAAEIENELNGPTAKAKQYLKLVTDRSGTTDGKNFLNVETGDSVMGASTALATNDKQLFRDFLFAERGRELYCEGWRRMDMIRFKNANGVSRYLEYASKIIPIISTSDTKWLLFPLPLQAMIPSNGLYQDNPGY